MLRLTSTFFTGLILSLTLATGASAHAAARTLPGGFFLEVNRAANATVSCEQSLASFREHEHLVRVRFHLSGTQGGRGNWSQLEFWNEFVPVLRGYFPWSKIDVFADSSFMITSTVLDAKDREEELSKLLATRIILSHPASQIRLEWRPDGSLSTSGDSATGSESNSRRRKGRHYWDAPSESDPVSGRERWDADKSDELTAPRGTDPGNRRP